MPSRTFELSSGFGGLSSVDGMSGLSVKQHSRETGQLTFFLLGEVARDHGDLGREQTDGRESEGEQHDLIKEGHQQFPPPLVQAYSDC